MSKHTPGPWAVHPVYHVAHGEPVTETGEFAIFTDDGFGNGLPIGYNDANARLIEVAPELLEALKSCQVEMVTLIPRLSEPYRSNVKAVAEMAAAVIARATGQEGTNQ